MKLRQQVSTPWKLINENGCCWEMQCMHWCVLFAGTQILRRQFDDTRNWLMPFSEPLTHSPSQVCVCHICNPFWCLGSIKRRTLRPSRLQSIRWLGLWLQGIILFMRRVTPPLKKMNCCAQTLPESPNELWGRRRRQPLLSCTWATHAWAIFE